ncbi:MAG TPA: acyl-CoA dehydrogenase family protein [Mycobacteriales bacterium]|nr:acyl-CoA dehydrogenase family protein [Mycobacteriales bacterium]
MDFTFTEEQQMLRAAARDFLDRSVPLERVTALADGDPGWDPGSWQQVSALGWLGLSVPTARAGAGMTFVEEAVVLEETGRGLYPGPYFSTVALAQPLLAAAESAAGTDLLTQVLGGSRTATVATLPGVTSAGDVLSGTSRHVPDLGIVDDVLVVVQGATGPGVWHVDLRAHPNVVRRTSTMDTTRRLGDLVLDDTPAVALLDPGVAAGALHIARLRGLAGLACEAVGVAQRCLVISADYAKERQQFGRPIGSYQGVSHRIANIYVALEMARSLAYWAAWSVSVDDPQAAAACSAAKAAGSEAAVLAAESAIQAMGGIGFTWDHPLHRFYKRAQWITAYDGHPREHRAALAVSLLDA